MRRAKLQWHMYLVPFEPLRYWVPGAQSLNLERVDLVALHRFSQVVSHRQDLLILSGVLPKLYSSTVSVKR